MCVCGADSNADVRNRQKFDLLIFAIRKLYALVQGEIKPDNPDALSSHELLLPGHIYNVYLKEKLQDWVDGIKEVIVRDIRLKPQNVNVSVVLALHRVVFCALCFLLFCC
jgi:DNA-directed RNA polymerase I subunit RPA2